MRTYIFAGGGTGGHLFPGIAVAQELQQRHPQDRVLFVGSEKELEQSILVRDRIEHRSLPVQSLAVLKRRPLHFALQNWRAWKSARRLIHSEQPDAVIGLGGYASAPVVWAAAHVGIPVVLLEQNVIPGRTNRWLSRSAAKVCVSFPEASGLFPAATRVVVTGNPLRLEIAALHQRSAAKNSRPESPQELLVLGGSQGADLLNDAVVTAALALKSELQHWRIVHQSGPRQAKTLRQTYESLSLHAHVEPFFPEMAERYQAASLVISRAGATTIAELTCCGLPTVLIPYPHAADDHQRANAESIRDRGAAVIVEHSPNPAETAQQLVDQLRSLLTDSDRRQTMSAAAFQLAQPNAAAAVADEILALVRSRN
ncbi:MAG: undecaprenyldiphospho-muramoylpentapeptide beta-N-acetylglucosaminyltransferase [Planctomycetes bacterium]|nr:undecaprenyldiphospho-muramoylpentapeptide beta-N-acetylglucosaminyltransferase [Planctomycetota bacterium]